MLWYSDLISHNIPLGDYMFITKAREFGEMIGISDLKFNYWKGCLDSFKKSKNLFQRTFYGEASSVVMEVVKASIILLEQFTSEFKLYDIYNFDETALFYRLKPNRPIKILVESKTTKTAPTIGVIANADGSENTQASVHF